MAEKVKSIDEFRDILRPGAMKKAAEHKKGLIEMIDKRRDPEIVDYHDIVAAKLEKDGVSYSALKRFRQSPMSYIDYLTTPFVQTPAMVLGDVLDVIVTTPEKFEELFFIVPEDFAKRSNEAKALYSLYMDMADGKTLIDNDTFQTALNMTESVYRNEDSRFYLDRMAQSQVWVNFKHRETGLKVRGILDWVSEEEPTDHMQFIVDFKTTVSAAPEDWPRQVAKYWYNGQIGLYTMAYKYNKWQFPDFIHVCIESSEPYNVNCFRSDPGMVKEAQEEVHNTLMAFKYCFDNNLWHKSYDFLRDGVLHYDSLKMPGYYKSKF